MLESLLPMMNFCLRSKSSGVKALALEAASYWTYLNHSDVPIFESLGHFTKDDKSIVSLLTSLWAAMGTHTISEKSQKLIQKVIF